MQQKVKQESALLLIGGLMCDDNLWQHQLRYINEYDYIYVPKLARMNCVEKFADSLIKEHSGKLDVVGFSSGGYVAQVLANKYPQQVQALMLINTVSFRTANKMRKKREYLLSLCENNRVDVAMSQFLACSLIGYQQKPSVRQKIASMLDAFDSRTFHRQLKAVCGLKYENMNIDCPTMVIGSGSDPFYQQASLDFAEDINDCKRIDLVGGGHYSPLALPSFITHAIKQHFNCQQMH